MDCIYSNPVASDLTPASASASWAFHTANCILTSSASATLSATIDAFNQSMHNLEYPLFLAFGLLIFVLGFWIGQWLFKR